MTQSKSFSIESREVGGASVLMLVGVIDEHAQLDLLAGLTGSVEINLRGIRRINSFGVRSWIDTIRQVPETTRMSFVECPPPIVDQLNMVVGFLGHGELVSFYVPMTCEECDEQLDKLFEVQACRALGGKLPPVPCVRCSDDMIVDDLEEQYLMFMRDGL